MKKVIGLGGIFFKAEDPDQIRDWYARHLGIIMQGRHGAAFSWGKLGKAGEGTTAWSPFKQDTDYFQPSTKSFMINYRVENLVALLETLRSSGVTIVGGPESYEYGSFAWIMDPEGNKIELWEPIDEGFPKEDPTHPSS